MTATAARVGTAYARTPLHIPEVHAISGDPGRYAIDFDGLSVYVTTAQWDAIVGAVRAQLAAYETAEVAS